MVTTKWNSDIVTDPIGVLNTFNPANFTGERFWGHIISSALKWVKNSVTPPLPKAVIARTYNQKRKKEKKKNTTFSY